MQTQLSVVPVIAGVLRRSGFICQNDQNNKMDKKKKIRKLNWTQEQCLPFVYFIAENKEY